jgi:hypothetical protein
MRTQLLLPVFAALVASGAAACAADLSKIDRTIAKEPAYRSPKPTYCLLVFGPAARTRVWVVRDGSVLYVDKNANGDLTDKGERLPADSHGRDFQPFEIADRAGPYRYHVTGIRVFEHPKGAFLSAEVEILGKFKQYGGGLMKERSRDAAVAHFNGPLAIGPDEDVDGVIVGNLARGDKPRELRVLVGTMDKPNGCWVVVKNTVSEDGKLKDFPTDIHPIAEVEFPPGQLGEKPVVRRYELKQRC